MSTVTGFSMTALEEFCGEFRDELGDNATTYNIRRIVKRKTESEECSLVDWWDRHEDGQARKLVGSATVFVSHAWGCRFHDLVEVIKTFWEKEGRRDDMFFWYDCFSANQHIEVLPFEVLKNLFGKSLQSMGRALIVLMPWNEPLYIKRCWCLFEFYTCITDPAIKYVIMMPKRDEQSFIESVKNIDPSDGGLFVELANIKSELATAENPSDMERIKTLIKETVGFHRLDARVYSALRDWFVSIVKSHFDKMSAETDVDHLRLMNHFGILLGMQGRVDEAEETHRKCLELTESRGDTLGVIQSLDNLAHCFYKQGRYAEAKKFHRQCLKMKMKTVPDDHREIFNSISNVAACLDTRGKYDAAERWHRKCFELRKELLGPNHYDTLSSLNNLAMTLDNMGKHDDAVEMHLQCLSSMESTLRKEHPDAVKSRSNLACCLNDLGMHEEAANMQKECLKLNVKMYGCLSAETACSLNNLAITLEDLGQYTAAEEMNRKCLVLRELILPENHQDTLWSMNNLASSLHVQQKYAEAEQWYRKCLKLRVDSLGHNHPDTLATLSNLNICLEDQNDQQ